MKKDFQQLFELQEIDKLIYTKKKSIEVFPHELEKLMQEEKALEIKCEAKKNEFKESEILKNKQETDIGELKEKIEKFNAQLFQIKTNAEYTKMLKQIDETKGTIVQREDSILEIMEKQESLQAELTAQQEDIKREKEKLSEKEAKCHTETTQLQSEIDVLITKKDTIKKMVAELLLQRYEHILKSRQDSAFVPVTEDGCCSACNMILTADVIDQAKLGADLVSCQTCSRLLYHPEILVS